MSKLTLNDIASLQNESSAITLINTNSALIETALENTLSRDGTNPNQMTADLDMNSNRILNLPEAVYPTDPVRKEEFDVIQAVVTAGVVGDLDVVIASEADAEAGTDNVKLMTPLRTKEAIDANKLVDTSGPLTPEQFGAVGDGTTNDTQAHIDWFAAMIAQGRKGFWGAGPYLIDQGNLIWRKPLAENSYAGPDIETIPGVTRIIYGTEDDLPMIALYADPGVDSPTSQTGTFTAGSAIVTGLSSTASMVAGNPIASTKVPVYMTNGLDRTWIVSIDSGTQVTLSQNATSSGSAALEVHGITEGSSGFITNGFLGGIIFDDQHANPYNPTTFDYTDTSPNRHGLLLSGVQVVTFGIMEGRNLRGDLCHIQDRQLNHITNGPGDLYDVQENHFQGLTQPSLIFRGCQGWSLNNRMSGQGFSGNIIDFITANNNTHGAWYGAGAGNICQVLSAGWCNDWAAYLAGNGSTGFGLNINQFEIDSCKNGIFFDQNSAVRIRGRIDYRFQEAGWQTLDAFAWPNQAIAYGSAGGHTYDIYVDYRIGGSINNTNVATVVNPLVDLNNNANVTNALIVQHIIDVSPATFTSPTQFFTNAPSVSGSHTGTVLKWDDRTIYDGRNSQVVRIAMASGATIPSTGWGSTAVLPYTVVKQDTYSTYNTSTNVWTCPFDGEWEVHATMLINVTAGNQGRLGILTSSDGTTYGFTHVGYKNASGGAKETFEVHGIVSLAKGNFLKIAGTTTGGTTIDASDTSPSTGSYLSIKPIYKG